MCEVSKIQEVLILFSSSCFQAQDSRNAGDLQREAITKVEFLTGNWMGSEWLITPDGMKRTVESTDIAETKLNGTVILFQGGVKAKFSESGDPVVVYEGLGMLSYNDKTQKYRLQHYGTDGSYADYQCTLNGKTLLCEQADNSGTINRVTISVDENGQWVEKGERSLEGNQWLQYFETTMSKVAGEKID